jgi:hypothetical protein
MLQILHRETTVPVDILTQHNETMHTPFNTIQDNGAATAEMINSLHPIDSAVEC